MRRASFVSPSQRSRSPTSSQEPTARSLAPVKLMDCPSCTFVNKERKRKSEAAWVYLFGSPARTAAAWVAGLAMGAAADRSARAGRCPKTPRRTEGRFPSFRAAAPLAMARPVHSQPSREPKCAHRYGFDGWSHGINPNWALPPDRRRRGERVDPGLTVVTIASTPFLPSSPPGTSWKENARVLKDFVFDGKKKREL